MSGAPSTGLLNVQGKIRGISGTGNSCLFRCLAETLDLGNASTARNTVMSYIKLNADTKTDPLNEESNTFAEAIMGDCPPGESFKQYCER